MRIVALLAEGVDRNMIDKNGRQIQTGSPSSRRAWIEISCPSGHPIIIPVALLAEGVDRNRVRPIGAIRKHVALLAEGVDRNSKVVSLNIKAAPSPSSRRAWIEIYQS